MVLKSYRLIATGEKGRLRFRRALILCHRHADADAYCAASSLYFLLKRLRRGIDVEVAAPSGFSAVAKRIAERFKTNIKENPDLHDKDIIIVVDTGNLELLEGWAEDFRRTKAMKVFVDHHPLSSSVKGIPDRLIVDEGATSTSEIVYRIFRAHGTGAGRKVARILLTGILADSQHLTIANSSTISVVQELLKEGASLDLARGLLTFRRDPSEVIARFKGALRLKVYRLGNWFYSTTEVGSFHASLARMLVDVGADVAMAFGEVEGEARACFRSSRNFYSESKIHLGKDVAEKLATMVRDGVGGGHPTAASLTAKVKGWEILEGSLALLERMTGTKAQPIT